MKKIMLYSFICAVISSCGLMTHKEALQNCYLGQVGSYQFDTRKTIMGGKFSEDSVRLSKLTITFKSDSTFFTNMQVPFLQDTFGYWDAGTCGFESGGTMTYSKSPVKENFDPCADSSIFNIIGQYREAREGTQYLWFKKISN